MLVLIYLCLILPTTVLGNGQLTVSAQNSTFISVQVQLNNGFEITEVTGSICTKVSDSSDCLPNHYETSYEGNGALIAYNGLEPGNQFELSVTQVTYLDGDGSTATMNDIGTIRICTLPIEPDRIELAEPVSGDGTQFGVTITPLDPNNWDYFEVTAYDYYTNEECLRERSNDSSTSLDITLPKFGVVYRIEARAVLQCGGENSLKSLMTADEVIMTGAPEMQEVPDLIFQNESMACYNWFLSKENAHYTSVKAAFGSMGSDFEWGEQESVIHPEQEAGVFCYNTPGIDTGNALTLRISSSVVDDYLELHSNSVPSYLNYQYQDQRINPTFNAECDERSCELKMNSQLNYVRYLNFPYELSTQRSSNSRQGLFHGSECSTEACMFTIDDLEPASEYQLSMWIGTLDGETLPFQFSYSFTTEAEMSENTDNTTVIVAVVVSLVIVVLGSAVGIFIGCKYFWRKYEVMDDKKMTGVIPSGNKYSDSPDGDGSPHYDEYKKFEDDGVYSEYKEGKEVDDAYVNPDEKDAESVYENPVYDGDEKGEENSGEKQGYAVPHLASFSPSVRNEYLTPVEQTEATSPFFESNEKMGQVILNSAMFAPSVGNEYLTPLEQRAETLPILDEVKKEAEVNRHPTAFVPSVRNEYLTPLEQRAETPPNFDEVKKEGEVNRHPTAFVPSVRNEYLTPLEQRAETPPSFDEVKKEGEVNRHPTAFVPSVRNEYLTPLEQRAETPPILDETKKEGEVNRHPTAFAPSERNEYLTPMERWAATHPIIDDLEEEGEGNLHPTSYVSSERNEYLTPVEQRAETPPVFESNYRPMNGEYYYR